MSRRWLLFLFCLSVLTVLAPLSRASLTIRVRESLCRVRFQHKAIEITLPLENPSGEATNQKIQLQILDPRNQVRATADRTESINGRSHELRIVVPFDVSALTEEDRRRLPWFRLQYRITNADAPFGQTADGIVSLSEITPELFELRVAAAEMAHEAMRYQARVLATHPITKKPAPGVRVDAVLTLET